MAQLQDKKDPYGCNDKRETLVNSAINTKEHSLPNMDKECDNVVGHIIELVDMENIQTNVEQVV